MFLVKIRAVRDLFIYAQQTIFSCCNTAFGWVPQPVQVLWRSRVNSPGGVCLRQVFVVARGQVSAQKNPSFKECVFMRADAPLGEWV
jgi:hypothetical protein